jgi:hypothetical protein
MVCMRWCLMLLISLSACEEFSASDGVADGSGQGGGGQSGDGGSAGVVQSSAGSVASAGRSSAGAHSTGGGDRIGGSGSAGVAEGGSSAAGASSAGAGGVLASECPCSAPTPTCVAGKCIVRGPDMVNTTTYYVDSTEVTSAQYARFLAEVSPKPNQQTAECSWNATFEPLFVQGQPKPLPNQPVGNIDYCDAAAFCAWADKRLCGRIGGGSLAFDELADVNKSQWFAACAGPKGQAYPYGAAFKSKACNVSNGGKGSLAAVGAFADCEGYYPGLVDMVGNAQEWTDTCDAHQGANDGCERIGGSYLDTPSPTCSTSGLAKRNLQAQGLGFRCCSK